MLVDLTDDSTAFLPMSPHAYLSKKEEGVGLAAGNA
jgi:hypothetical protein